MTPYIAPFDVGFGGRFDLARFQGLGEAMGNAVCPPCARDILGATVHSMWGVAA